MDTPEYLGWINKRYILSTKGFPSSTSLRWRRGRETGVSYRNCGCGHYERHSDVLNLLREVVNPWARAQGTKGNVEFPKIEVCYNANNLWVDNIPKSISFAEKNCKFVELETLSEVENVLTSCTYWYSRIRRSKNGRSRHARAILRLVAGLTGYQDRSIKDSELLTLKPTHSGFNRLRSLLATVDGLLIQLMLSFMDNPTMWKWSTYDRITHSVIMNLLPDYLNPNKKSTAFAELKTIRQSIKESGFAQNKSVACATLRRFSYFNPLLSSLGDDKSPDTMVRVNLLSQTRAAGVPPPAVKRAAIEKWVETVSTPSSQANAEKLTPDIIQAVDDFYDEVIKGVGEDQLVHFFAKCMRSAKISLSDSAELDHSVVDGGKLEAARERIQSLGRVPELDLHTGRETGNYFTVENGGIGEMLFHSTLARFASGPYSDNKMSVRVSAVAELGKYRTVTVSSHDHAILLHPVSHMTLRFFADFMPASAGIKASNQAWEFFRRISGANPAAGFIFNSDSEKVIFSTDWSQSTDWCDHYIANVMLTRFFHRIGVPLWYAKMCVFALTAPRVVLHPLKDGKPWLTKRAVLMGDPGTKSLLTLYHPVARSMALRVIESLRKDMEDESESSDSPVIPGT